MSQFSFRSIRVLGLLLSTFAFTSNASASSITIASDSRAIGGNADVGATADNYGHFASTPLFTATDSADAVTAAGTAHSDATQTSSAQGPTLGGTGALNLGATSTTESTYVDAQSGYSVRFDLTEAFAYSWSANIDVAFDPGQLQAIDWFGQATAFLYDLGSGTYLQYTAVNPDASNPILANSAAGTGVLQPGSYWLWGQAAGYGRSAAGLSFGGYASFDTALTLTPLNPTAVPEPGTLTLVGSGAVAAMLRRRRRAI